MTALLKQIKTSQKSPWRSSVSELPSHRTVIRIIGGMIGIVIKATVWIAPDVGVSSPPDSRMPGCEGAINIIYTSHKRVGECSLKYAIFSDGFPHSSKSVIRILE